MNYVTKYTKRRNVVKLCLNTKKKRIIESMYTIPENRLIKRISFTGNTIEEIVYIYFEKINKYNILGYKSNNTRDGKIIFVEFN
ncbi:hypothetical protein [Defluviitalea phaphyphila]|uniref:hypothetical protein n=1 Tax=Defluviitalea phaphyphila TaxID=1473580 RepID=UPI000730FA36|nr:hypothetical protein [Defluviitalea phaphyphila]